RSFPHLPCLWGLQALRTVAAFLKSQQLENVKREPEDGKSLMPDWSLVVVVLAGIPLARAWWANRDTALSHAMVWFTLAWLAWIWNAAIGDLSARYLSLCLTACAGVAVLGARRPGVVAWNVVVVGLLAVLVIPLGQDYLAGNSWLLGPIWRTFLGVI